MKVFLLAGQSNMQGFGPVADYPVLSDDRIFNLATGHAEHAVEPLHSWHEHQMPDGLGLAMPFALEVLKVFPDIQIGFIPSAYPADAECLRLMSEPDDMPIPVIECFLK